MPRVKIDYVNHNLNYAIAVELESSQTLEYLIEQARQIVNGTWDEGGDTHD